MLYIYSKRYFIKRNFFSLGLHVYNYILHLKITFYLPYTQVELENWVNSIHSACAAAFARHRGKTGTLHLLQEEIFRLDKAIESVCANVCIYNLDINLYN